MDIKGGRTKLFPGVDAVLTVNLALPIIGVVELKDLPFEVLEVNEDRICWAYQMVPKVLQPYMLTTRRCMEIRTVHLPPLNQPNNQGEPPKAVDTDPPTLPERRAVQVRHFDRNTGPLAPLIEVLFKSAIENGFLQMTDDLQIYVASLIF